MRIEVPFAPRRGSPLPQYPPPGPELDLSIDPGQNTGWALWWLGQLISCGIGEPPFQHVRQLAIEIPQAYQNSEVPYNDLITLAFQAGRYAGASGANVVVETYRPHDWKGSMSKSVSGYRVRVKLSPTELAVLAACERVVPAKQMHNVLDAIGVGLVAHQRKI